MTRQEQYDKLQEASKLLYDAMKKIREAKSGGDNVKRPFFGRIRVAHDKATESRELLAETCHDLRREFPEEVK